jgi:hypothetical protein
MVEVRQIANVLGRFVAGPVADPLARRGNATAGSAVTR